MTGNKQKGPYVITEDELWQLRVRKKKNPLGQGYGSKYLSVGYYEIDDIFKSVHSHPISEEIRKAREDELRQLKESCKCIPLKEYAPDFDRGFHQAMTLVRGWCDQKIKSLGGEKS